MRYALLFLLIISSNRVFGQFGPDTLSVLPDSYDVIKHQRRAMGVLTGWSVLSVGMGTAQLFSANPQIKGFGMQNLSWGLIDGLIAGYATYDLNKKLQSGRLNLVEERQTFRKVLLINTFLDLLYIGTGAAMMKYGSSKWQGHGAGIVLQGSFLLLFDGINYGLTF